jgi:hypothetical protein
VPRAFTGFGVIADDLDVPRGTIEVFGFSGFRLRRSRSGETPKMSTKPTVTRPKSLRVKMQGPEVDLGFQWSPANTILLVAGIAVLTVGYLNLQHGSITMAPVLLVFGYCGLIPASLLVRVGGADRGE